MIQFRVHQKTKLDRISAQAITVWAAILFLIGGKFRFRESTLVPTYDWLIVAQLLMVSLGAVLGFMLLKKNRAIGFGAQMSLLLIFFMGLSIFTSSYGKLVFGYWFLFFGTFLLTMGLIQNARVTEDLFKLEKVWLITAFLTLMFNVIGAFIFSDAGLAGDDTSRFGTSWGHPSNFAYFACFTFCLSYMKKDMFSPVFQRIIRVLLILLILATRTRIPLMICFLVMIAQFAFTRKRFSHIWFLLGCIGVFLAAFFALAISFDLPFTADLSVYLARGDFDSLGSFTGRIDIWTEALNTLAKTPGSLLSGFGYGVSRLTLNAVEGSHFFYAHTHNEFIEIVFGMGIFCLIPYFMLLLYSFKWMFSYRELCPKYSQSFVHRAITVMVAYYVALFFGVPLSNKIAPYTMIILFYILSLDKSNLIRPSPNVVRQNL